MRREREPITERQCGRFARGPLRRRPQRADDTMRVPERHALGHKRVRELDREQIQRQRRGDAFAVRRERVDRRRQCQEQHVERVRRVEHRFFVLLQILLVRARQALEQHGEALRVREQPRALAARQLEEVGVPLLRQQRRAGRKAIRGREPAERGRAEEHEIFGEPREMHAEEPGGIQVLEREVAVAHGVERVQGDARESEPRGERRAVVTQGRPRHRAGSERQAVRGLARLGEPLLVARERFDVREPPVREPHGLRGLQVRVGRAREIAGAARLADERPLQLAHALDRAVAELHDVHAEERRDLVVA